MSKTKLEKLNEEDARKLILGYMEKEYRPYAVTDIVLNLHNRINKNMLNKILDEMVEENLIIIKKYGKLSFYCYTERKPDENVKLIDFDTLKAINKEVEDLNNDLNILKTEILTLKAEPSDMELRRKHQEHVKIQENLKQMIASYKEKLKGQEQKTVHQLKEIDSKEKEMYLKHKKLKKIHDEIINTLKEGIENFDEMIKGLGIETIPEI